MRTHPSDPGERNEEDALVAASTPCPAMVTDPTVTLSWYTVPDALCTIIANGLSEG